jgi:hypothetical protein
MSQTDYLAADRFRIGVVISKSARVFFRRPLTYAFWTWGPTLAASMLAGTVAAILGPYVEASGPHYPGGPQTSVEILVPFLPLLSLVLLAVIVSASCSVTLQIAWQDLRGYPVRLGTAIGEGFSRILPLTGVTFLAGGLTLLGVGVYLIPGMFLASMWAVAGPVCAFERLGPIRSMGRSRRMTKGFRWRMLGLMAALMVLNFCVASLGLALERYVSIQGVFFVAPVLVWVLIQLAMIPFFCVSSAVAYHELRIAREGVDIENLASVFD